MAYNIVHFILNSPLWFKLIASFVMLLSIVLNLVEAVLLLKRRRKNNYEKLLLSLSANEFLNGLLNAPLLGYVMYGGLNDHIFLVWTCMLANSVTNSLIHLMLISMDRLWALSAPINHRSYAARRNVGVFALVTSWCAPLIAVLGFVVNIIASNHVSTYKDTFPILMQFIAVIILIADMVFCICYGTIVVLLLKRKQPGKRIRSKQQKRVLILCFSVVFVFIFSSTPIVVIHLINWKHPEWLQLLGWCLYPVNAILNSVIFLVQDYRIKKQASSSLLIRESKIYNMEQENKTEKTQETIV